MADQAWDEPKVMKLWMVARVGDTPTFGPTVGPTSNTSPKCLSWERPAFFRSKLEV